MRWTVGSDKSCAVNCKSHRQALNGNVVNNLIVRPLQECRVDRREGFHAFGCQPCCKRHGVLLSNADIERAIWKFARKYVKPRAVRHGRGNGNDVFILARFLDKAIGENAGIALCFRLWF